MELFFALLKLEKPEKVKDHPVFKELVRYRTLLERIRPLDRKMKYQVDKMLKVALSGGKGLDESLSYAPNPDELAAEDGQDDDEDGEEGGSSSKDGIYRAPRLAAVPYEEEERAQVKQAKKEERNRQRLQKSTILAELREEFSERPTEILASGTSVVDKEIAREEAEKKEFEESRFVRVVTSRKDKIRKRQREMEANRADNVGSIDNFAAVQDILSLDKTKHRIPTSREPKKIGGKTGGIFSHVDAPVSDCTSKVAGSLLHTNANSLHNFAAICRLKKSERYREMLAAATLVVSLLRRHQVPLRALLLLQRQKFRARKRKLCFPTCFRERMDVTDVTLRNKLHCLPTKSWSCTFRSTVQAYISQAYASMNSVSIVVKPLLLRRAHLDSPVPTFQYASHSAHSCFTTLLGYALTSVLVEGDDIPELPKSALAPFKHDNFAPHDRGGNQQHASWSCNGCAPFWHPTTPRAARNLLACSHCLPWR
ncbi:unnamed protein product [Phytophthora lilii]|uniref:Unnamed protein product n=1 Tax=Phytophthora lilii TaxID=2077276 RepID=A0A9W6XIS9_9STRA|nr:unnamed protein product [Phytophthora lilii]